MPVRHLQEVRLQMPLLVLLLPKGLLLGLSSGKTLAQKLGIKAGNLAAFLNAPEGYGGLLGELLQRVTVVGEPKGKLDFIQLFATDRSSLERELPRLRANLKEKGMIWVSWPKRTSKMQSDLGDRVVREIGLKNGLVDVKVCAIDSSWSALKFVRRTRDRHASSIGA